jgi:hypothetical protein
MRRFTVSLAALACTFGGLFAAVARPAAADPTLPSLTVGDVSVWEGNAGFLVVRVPVDLSVIPATTVTAYYTVSTDNASPDSASTGDFVAHQGKLVFQANGVPSKSVLVRVIGDINPEPDEHVLVHITSISGANVEKGDGGVTILNDDSGSGSGVTVGIGDVTVVEADNGTHVASLPVTLSVPAPGTIKVHYGVGCGSAGSSDYSTRSGGFITFGSGQQTKFISFTIKADLNPETVVKQVIDNILVVLGPAVVRAAQGATTIVDNDGSAPPAAPGNGPIERVSVGMDGGDAQPPPANICETGNTPAPTDIWGEAISRDGHYVAFASSAANIVDGDTNGIMDVFVRDLQTNATERVSLKPDGSQFTAGNTWAGGSYDPAISADGRYVTFISGVTGLLYLRDRLAGTTQAITANSVGNDEQSSISDDGRYVAYGSENAQSPGVTLSPYRDGIYLWDRDTGTTSLIDVRSQIGGDTQTVSMAYNWGPPQISGNGRYIAFTDGSADLVPGDTNTCPDTFVRDLQTGDTERVSVTTAGAEQMWSWPAANYPGVTPWHLCSDGRPTISDDGRFVGFNSAAPNMYPGGGDPVTDHVYLRDRQLGTTELIDTYGSNQAWDGFEAISDDGRYVLYGCNCGDPLPIAPGSESDIVSMWLDRQTGTTLEVGVQSDGTPPIDEDLGSWTRTLAIGGVSGDGHTVAFTSKATNLVPDDANGMEDAFVQQLG